MRKTKIICTIGPATSSIEMLTALAAAGMNVARLNMSHGDHDFHISIIQRIQTLNQTLKHPIAILVDTQGPEIRTGDRPNDLDLKTGDIVSVVARGVVDVEASSIQVNYADLIHDVGIGDKITVDNGLINLEVLEKSDPVIKTFQVAKPFLVFYFGNGFNIAPIFCDKLIKCLNVGGISHK